MKIILGTTNKTKVEAVEEGACFLKGHLKSVPTLGEEGLFPFTDEETLLRATHMATKSIKKEKADLGVGLEDGVIQIGAQLYALCWGALVDKRGNLFIASGARLPIPDDIARLIQRDQTLAHTNPAFTERAIARSTGAIGILTSGMNTLKDEYLHIVRLLVGQFKTGSNGLYPDSVARSLVQTG